MILNKVTDCYLTKEGQRIEIQDDQLYHVVTDLYTGQMLGSVNKMSYGLLSLEPKDKDGNPIENLENHIIGVTTNKKAATILSLQLLFMS